MKKERKKLREKKNEQKLKKQMVLNERKFKKKSYKFESCFQRLLSLGIVPRNEL